VRYTFYNASKLMNTKKARKEGKPHGKNPPLKVECIKNEDEQCIKKKGSWPIICPSLHGYLAIMQVYVW
jgi:hypothetical protein